MRRRHVACVIFLFRDRFAWSRTYSGMSVSTSCLREVSSPCPPPSHLAALPGGLGRSPAPRRDEAAARAAGSSSHIDEAPRPGLFVVSASSPDDVLALAACAGDPRAPAIISKRYGGRVRSKLHHWIGPQDIDDHVQDVFLRLFEQLPRMRDPGALRGFLVGITLRIACTELRRRRRSRMRLTATGELPEPRVTLDDKGPAREALWRFESILDKLAPSSRRVFVLRFVEKLELTEVAARMRISVATAKRHLARAAATVSAMVKREPALAEYMLLQRTTVEPKFLSASA
jgi:RNA polymerase sigma-70 factor (ECF subfamily)